MKIAYFEQKCRPIIAIKQKRNENKTHAFNKEIKRMKRLNIFFINQL